MNPFRTSSQIHLIDSDVNQSEYKGFFKIIIQQIINIWKVHGNATAIPWAQCVFEPWLHLNKCHLFCCSVLSFSLSLITFVSVLGVSSTNSVSRTTTLETGWVLKLWLGVWLEDLQESVLKCNINWAGDHNLKSLWVVKEFEELQLAGKLASVWFLCLYIYPSVFCHIKCTPDMWSRRQEQIQSFFKNS